MDTWHIFIKWWETEQEKFHCGQFSEREIAYSAWLAGIGYYTKEHIKKWFAHRRISIFVFVALRQLHLFTANSVAVF